MNLDKAIEILATMGKPDFNGNTEDILAARLLGIEALQVIQRIRNQSIFRPWELLSGETKD